MTDNCYTKEFKERIQRPGQISFTAILTNDSYKGLDQISKVAVDVKAQPTNRSIYEYKKEDIKAIREPSLMQQALDQGQEDTDEDEEELDEQTELMKKL